MEGQFCNGKREGWSRTIWSDGDFEFGWYKNNMPHGRAKICASNIFQEGLFEKDILVPPEKQPITYKKDSKIA